MNANDPRPEELDPNFMPSKKDSDPFEIVDLKDSQPGDGSLTHAQLEDALGQIVLKVHDLPQEVTERVGAMFVQHQRNNLRIAFLSAQNANLLDEIEKLLGITAAQELQERHNESCHGTDPLTAIMAQARGRRR